MGCAAPHCAVRAMSLRRLALAALHLPMMGLAYGVLPSPMPPCCSSPPSPPFPPPPKAPLSFLRIPPAAPPASPPPPPDADPASPPPAVVDTASPPPAAVDTASPPPAMVDTASPPPLAGPPAPPPPKAPLSFLWLPPPAPLASPPPADPASPPPLAASSPPPTAVASPPPTPLPSPPPPPLVNTCVAQEVSVAGLFFGGHVAGPPAGPQAGPQAACVGASHPDRPAPARPQDLTMCKNCGNCQGGACMCLGGKCECQLAGALLADTTTCAAAQQTECGVCGKCSGTRQCVEQYEPPSGSTYKQSLCRSGGLGARIRRWCSLHRPLASPVGLPAACGLTTALLPHCRHRMPARVPVRAPRLRRQLHPRAGLLQQGEC